MVTSLLKIKIPRAKKKDAIQTVRTILGRTCAQPGCISMAFYQDTNNPGIMMLYEEWEDWPNLENHIQSDAYRSILELMELSSEKPEINFYNTSNARGMEIIEKLRG